MKIAYAVARATGALEPIGTAGCDVHNNVWVEFDLAQLARVEKGEFRPFVLVGPSKLAAWPTLPADLVQHEPKTKLWSEFRGELPVKRPQTWVGWPLFGDPLVVAEFSQGEPEPIATMLLLRPLVPIETLTKHELVHDGFLLGFREGPNPNAASLPPFRSEPAMPASGAYTQEMTEAFSEAQAAIAVALADDDEGDDSELAAVHDDPPVRRVPVTPAPMCDCGRAPLTSLVEQDCAKCDLCIRAETELRNRLEAEPGNPGPESIGSTLEDAAQRYRKKKKGAADGMDETGRAGSESAGALPAGDASERPARAPRKRRVSSDADSDGNVGNRRKGRRVAGDGAAAPGDVPGGGAPVGTGGADDAGAGAAVPASALEGGAGGAGEAAAGVAPSAGLEADDPAKLERRARAVRRREREGAQGSLFAMGEPKPLTPPPARVCMICGSPMATHVENGHVIDEACSDREHYRGISRVPLHTAAKYGPSSGALRVRAITNGGLRFVEPGMEFDAERCPERPLTDVWIVCPAGVSKGVSYRLNAGEWEPVAPAAPRRRSRSLDDL